MGPEPAARRDNGQAPGGNWIWTCWKGLGRVNVVSEIGDGISRVMVGSRILTGPHSSRPAMTAVWLCCDGVGLGLPPAVDCALDRRDAVLLAGAFRSVVATQLLPRIVSDILDKVDAAVPTFTAVALMTIMLVADVVQVVFFDVSIMAVLDTVDSAKLSFLPGIPCVACTM